MPPRNIFPRGHRQNLITVPACEDHNEGFKLIDERFRFYLQAVSYDESSEAQDHFEGHTVKVFSDPEKAGFRKSLSSSSYKVVIDGDERAVFEIDRELQEAYFEKILRGLYFVHTNTILPYDYHVVSYSFLFQNENTDAEGLASDIREFYKVLRPFDIVEGVSQNQDIFNYQFVLIESTMYVRMTFYKHVIVHGFLNKKPQALIDAAENTMHSE